MSAKNTTHKNKSIRKAAPAEQQKWKRWALALTLVPLIVGGVLIFAWAIDWDLWGRLEDQIVIGTIFIFFSFGLNNALQDRWVLATSWLLLMVADWMVLLAANSAVQRFGIVLGMGGLLLLGFEYFRRIAQNREAKSRKP